MDAETGTVTISESQIEYKPVTGENGGVMYTSARQALPVAPRGGAAGGGIYAGGRTAHPPYDVIQDNRAQGGYGMGGSGSESHNDSGRGL